MDQRPPAEELLQHPWVKGKAEAPYVDRKSAAQILENLNQFKKMNTFQTGIVCLLSNMILQEKDVKELRKVFEKCDKDNNGVLSATEISENFGEIIGGLEFDEMEWKQIID